MPIEIALLRNHGGRSTAGGVNFEACGFNYRLSEIPAALGLAQLHRLEAIVADRRATAHRYMALIGDLDLTIPLAAPAELCSFQSFVVLLGDACDRDAVIARMREADVETTLGTYAMHAHPAFSRFSAGPGSLPHAYHAQNQSLTLPLLPRMDPELIARVVDVLTMAMRGARRPRAAAQ